MQSRKIFFVSFGNDPGPFAASVQVPSLLAENGRSLVQDVIAKAGAEPAGFVLSPHCSADTLRRTVECLRRNAKVRLLPVLTLKKPEDAAAGLLTDGTVSDAREAAERCDDINSTLETFLPGCTDYDDPALLAYLISRRRSLKPVRSPNAPLYYEYPAAQCFCRNPEKSVFGWLHRLEKDGLLRESSLVDRVYSCPFCGSAHLSYVDKCVNCESFDIEKKELLHCFTCGYVGVKDDFFQDGSLVCPHCRTRLRHIGTDYDRPLDKYICNNCGSSFTDPDVIATCMNCGEKSAPDRLYAKRIVAYSVTDRALQYVLEGHRRSIYEKFGQSLYINREYFLYQYDWMLAMARQYPDFVFSIIGYRFSDMRGLVRRHGKTEAYALIRAFAERVKGLLRPTDVFTRTGQGTFWILLPYTDAAGLSSALEKLRALKSGAFPDDWTAQSLKTVGHVEDGKPVGETGADILLSRYAEEFGW